MGLDLDLAAVAGMAGLGGSAIAGLGAAFFFRGLITRVISQIILTTILSFIGFVALFHSLGFTIVPPKQIAGINIPGSSNFSVQTAPDPAAEGGYTIKSPWSKQD
ncbi:MAG: hypothetical protein ABL956_06180 [Hyphomonadaceae bacterium]